MCNIVFLFRSSDFLSLSLFKLDSGKVVNVLICRVMITDMPFDLRNRNPDTYDHFEFWSLTDRRISRRFSHPQQTSTSDVISCYLR